MVYISPNTTQAMLEAKLAKALGVIGASQDLSQQCVPYTLPSLCFSSFPVCRKDSPAQPPRRICRQVTE
ncbi:tyrosine-protein kinase transmembrane receptor Ror-like, partial [Diaphorina citri]|uniref:Tyrosine-protein kinase transmembrane receptor Ror-like n=1 Tax=Diaphorina citri TaxID=121845 RepID=A0A1S4EPQ6_DIACI